MPISSAAPSESMTLAEQLQAQSAKLKKVEPHKLSYLNYDWKDNRNSRLHVIEGNDQNSDPELSLKDKIAEITAVI